MPEKPLKSFNRTVQLHVVVQQWHDGFVALLGVSGRLVAGEGQTIQEALDDLREEVLGALEEKRAS